MYFILDEGSLQLAVHEDLASDLGTDLLVPLEDAVWAKGGLLMSGILDRGLTYQVLEGSFVLPSLLYSAVHLEIELLDDHPLTLVGSVGVAYLVEAFPKLLIPLCLW